MVILKNKYFFLNRDFFCVFSGFFKIKLFLIYKSWNFKKAKTFSLVSNKENNKFVQVVLK